MNIREVDPVPLQTQDPSRVQRVSIYPSSMLGYRQMQGIPGCWDAMTFIMNASRRGQGQEPFYKKEGAARAVCGAMCALVRDSSCDHSGVYRGGRSGGRVHFLEDIECDEMHNYAQEIGSLIKSGRSSRMRVSMPWPGSKVTLHCVQVGKEKSVPVFAFCREGDSAPFAMTGMRHILWTRRPALEGGRSIHQYKESRESMVEVCATLWAMLLMRASAQTDWSPAECRSS